MSFPCRTNWQLPPLIAVVFALAAIAATPSSASDAAFAEGLHERRLDRLVDQFCRQRLAEPELSDASKVDVAVAWLRVGTLRALEASPQQQAAAWEAFADLVAECRPLEESPRGLLVNVQIALATLTRAEVVTHQATSHDAADVLATARELVRSALGKLQSARQQLDEHLHAARQRRGAADSDWTVGELDALERNLIVQLAKAYRTQALCYPEGSPDSLNALGLAVEQLRSLPVTSDDDPTLWRARVEHIVCLRLLGQVAEARRHYDHWHGEVPSERIAARLVAEELLLDLTEGQTAAALAKAKELLPARPSEAEIPETNDAILQVLLAARSEAESDEAQRLTEQAAAQVRHISQAHGPYWKRRAESSLGQALAGTGGASDPSLLVHAAESLYRAGNFAEALSNYDRAVEQLYKDEKREEGFLAARTAAAIAREAGRGNEAADRFRRAALQYREHAEAADSHLTAIGLWADQTRSTVAEDRTGHLQRYQSLLKEHLEIWPHAASADTVRWWLGQRLHAGRQWVAAADVLTGVSPTSSHFDEAIALAASCYEKQLRESEDSTSAERQAIALKATTQLQPIITGSDNRWPEGWTDLQRTVALDLADLQLRYVEGGTSYAERILQVALRDAQDADTTWVAEASAVLALARLRAGDVSGAVERLSNTKFPNAAAIADSLPRLIESLEVPTGVGQSPHAELVEVLRRILQSAHRHPDATEPSVLQSLDLSVARLELLRGDSTGARAIFRRLLEADGTAGDLHELIAALLGRSNSEEDLRESLRIWHVVEQRSQPAGQRWIRARQARIEVLERLGDDEQADKLRRVTALLYPQLP